MCHVVVIGAGITGVTTAYELSQLGYQVTVVDRHLFPAMETSFANGGQLSACNAEVWNQKSTVLKGMKWMSLPSTKLSYISSKKESTNILPCCLVNPNLLTK